MPNLVLAERQFLAGDLQRATYHYGQYVRRAQQTSRSLWVGIRIAQATGDQDSQASYELLLRNQFSNSAEYWPGRSGSSVKRCHSGDARTAGQSHSGSAGSGGFNVKELAALVRISATAMTAIEEDCRQIAGIALVRGYLTNLQRELGMDQADVLDNLTTGERPPRGVSGASIALCRSGQSA